MSLADSKPLVSIGMPVYNGEKYLRQALDSLLTQDYENFELIISDNASIDRTAEICKEYVARDRRVRYYRSKNNQGAASNFKYVLQMARGVYFMWAAHDDLWEPNFISFMVTIHESNHNVSIAFCEFNTVDNKDKEIRKFQKLKDLQKVSIKERIGAFLAHGRREGRDHLIYGLFLKEKVDEALRQLSSLYLVRGFDHIFVLRLLNDGMVIIEPRLLFHKRIDSSSYYDDPCTEWGRKMLKKGWRKVAFFPGMWMHHKAVRTIIRNSQLSDQDKLNYCLVDLRIEFVWFTLEILKIISMAFMRLIHDILCFLHLIVDIVKSFKKMVQKK